MRYRIAKMKAIEFANESGMPVYIAMANKKDSCIVLLDESDINGYPLHSIIEVVRGEREDNIEQYTPEERT